MSRLGFVRMLTIAIFLVAFGMTNSAHAMDFVSVPTTLQQGIPDGYSVPISIVAYDTAERQTYRMEIRYGADLLYATAQRLRWRIETGGYARFHAISPDVDMITARSLGGTDCDMWVNWWVYWCYNYGVGSSYSTLLYNKQTGARMNIANEAFVNGTELALISGGNIDVYRPDYATMTLGEKIRTVPRPGPNFAVMNEYFPILLTGDGGTKGYVYRGTDGRSYAVSVDFSVDVPLSFPAIDLSGRSAPIGKIGNNGFVVSREDGGGSWYVADASANADPVRLDATIGLSALSAYENPRYYFRTVDGRTVAWDRNCRDAGYNSCRAVGESYMCANESGESDPIPRSCNALYTDFSLLSATFDASTDTQSVSLRPRIALRFGSMPDVDSFLASIRIVRTDSSAQVPYDLIGWGNNAATLVPRATLSANATYELRIGTDLTSTTGVRFGSDQVVAFQTGSGVSANPQKNLALAPIESPCPNGACNISQIRTTQHKNQTRSKNATDTQSALDPVELSTLDFTYDNTLLTIPGSPLSYAFDVIYRSRTYYDGPMGFGWDHSYHRFLTEDADGSVSYSDGRLGTHTFELTASGSGFEFLSGLDATLEKVTGTGTYTIRFRDGHMEEYGTNLQIARLLDANGNSLRFDYNDSGELATVTDDLGYLVTYSYVDHRLARVTDSLGRAIEIGYYHTGDANGAEYDLASFLLRFGSSPSDTKLIGFTYDGSSDPSLAHNIATMTDARGGVYVKNTYDADDRIIAQTYGSGSGSYEYTLWDLHADDTDTMVGTGEVVGHYISTLRATNRRGVITEYVYDRYGSMLSREVFMTDTGSIVTTYEYDTNHRLISETLPRGNGTTWRYDANGNTIEERRKARMSDSDGENDLVSSWEYDLATDLLLSSTTVGGVRSGYAYDERRSLIRTTMTGIHTLSGTLADREILAEYDWSGRILSETDPEGRAARYTYDSQGFLASITRGAGGEAVTESYESDAHGNRTARIDPVGNRTTYEYDAFERLVRSASSEWAVIEYVYDGNDNRTSERIGSETLWKTASTEYDILDHPVLSRSAIDASTDAITRTEYDANENISAVVLSNGLTRKFSYDALDRPISETVVSATGMILSEMTREYDANGNVIRETDPLGHTTVTEYDLFDRPIRITDPMGNYTEIVYDHVGNVATRTAYDAAGIRRSERRTVYDEIGQLLSETSVSLDAGGAETGSGDLVSRTEYDRSGLVTATIDPAGGRTSRTYDSLGRLVRVTDLLANMIESVYDARSLVTESRSIGADGKMIARSAAYDRDGRLVRTAQSDGMRESIEAHSYDALGRRISTTDPSGLVTSYEYDLADRPLSETVFERSSAGAITPRTTRRSYDLLGNLLSLTDASGNRTEYAYDPLGRKTSEQLADASKTRWDYDVLGNVTERTDANGTTMRNTYDALGRLTHRMILLGSGVSGMTDETYSYDALGRLVSASDNNGSTLAFSYDSHGRLVSESQDGRTIVSGYDVLSDRTDLTLPSGQRIATQYDALGRMTGIFDITASGSIAQYEYSGRDLTRSILGNGTESRRTYDALGRLADLSHVSSTGSNLLPIRAFSYDVRSQMTSNGSDSFAYDSLGRLMTESDRYDNGDTNKESFSYDPVGNRTVSSISSLTNALATTCKNQLVNGKYQRVCTSSNNLVSAKYAMSYSGNTLHEYAKITGEPYVSSQQTIRPTDISTKFYDQNGNMTDNGKYRFSYDAYNRLVSVSDKAAGWQLASYAYDVLGRRTKKTTYRTSVGSIGKIDREIRYISSGNQVVEEEEYRNDTASGTLRLAERRSLVSGPLGIDDTVVMIRTTVGQTGATDRATIYYHASENGSVLALSSATGTILEVYRYDAFGRPQIRSGNVYVPFTASALGNSRLFTGREYEGESGIYHYRARAYDPLYGRFLQRDPIGTSDQINPYAYVRNDPIGFMDPMGKRAKAAIVINKAYELFSQKQKQYRFIRKMWDTIGSSHIMSSSMYQMQAVGLFAIDTMLWDSNIKIRDDFWQYANQRNDSPEIVKQFGHPIGGEISYEGNKIYLADIGNMLFWFNANNAWYGQEFMTAWQYAETTLKFHGNIQAAIKNEEDDNILIKAGYSLGLNSWGNTITKEEFTKVLLHAAIEAERIRINQR